MSVNLKDVQDQTIVITGASSGIGLCTARMAAERGANVVLVARNEEALQRLTDEINSGPGGRAAYSVADVADEEALRQAARVAETEFGGFDTWVNNAGVSVYGRIMDVPVEDFKRLFETNFWGTLHGSRIAAERLSDRGGAIINVGSEVSDSPVPLQGIYSASKHALKGFTDSFRMELEADGLPVSISLVKPTATHTPYPENARNYLPYEPTLPPPIYAPELVAEAILFCAENQVRDFYVGEMAKLRSSMAHFTPKLGSMMMEATIDSMQNSGKPALVSRTDGLYDTNSNLRERGREDRYVLETSPYVTARMHPLLTAGLLLGGGVALAAWWRGGSLPWLGGSGRRGHIDIHGEDGRQIRGSEQFNQAAAGGF